MFVSKLNKYDQLSPALSDRSQQRDTTLSGWNKNN